MTLTELKDRLEKIYLQLEQLSASDNDQAAAIRDQLGHVLADLPEADDNIELTLSEQLKQAVARFETEHPTLAKTAEEVIDSLARMGI